MMAQWINWSGSADLLIFFNGWGMDARPFSRLDSSKLDVLMFYDYSSLNMHCDITALTGEYSKCHLAAWSLGVWAAACALSDRQIQFTSATAINGTLQPVDAENGIAPEIFQGTIDSWNAVTRRKFYRRMCVSLETAAAFYALEPERDADSQKQELTAIQQLVLQRSPLPCNNLFKRAVIGREDRIFPVAAQEKAWNAAGAPCKITAAPHYPFSGLRHWKELIDFEQN
ncbi:MAG: pimeloyl-ACP methyl esterase BioG family protein [Lentisphaerota bacterium]